MQKLLALFLTLALSATLTAPANAQRSGYDTAYKTSDLSIIGEVEIERRRSNVTIDVGGAQGQLEAIALRSPDRRLRLRHMTIYFQDGSAQDVELYDRLDRNETSRIIDLKGERRRIKRIELSMRPSFRRIREPYILELLGVESGPDLRHLATGIMNSRARYVALPVGTAHGQLTGIALRAVGRSFRVREIDIHFRDGSHQLVRVNRSLREGEVTSLVDLKGKNRFIKDVEIFLRPSFRRRRGKIELYGHEGTPELIPLDTVRVVRPNRRDYVRVTLETPPRILRSKSFGGIALRSLDRRLRLLDATVVFGSGKRRKFPLNRILAPNQITNIMYYGGQRGLRSVIVTVGRSRHLRHRARLQLLATEAQIPNAKPAIVRARDRRRYDDRRDRYDDRRRDRDRYDDRRRDRDRYDDRRRDRDWVLLGTRKASLFIKDQDTFRIGRDMGRFSAIRVSAKDQDIRMYGMRIVYGNGSVETVPIYGTLEEGQTSQPYDLKGRKRYIDHIEFRYRTRLNFRGVGELELWGKQNRRRY